MTEDSTNTCPETQHHGETAAGLTCGILHPTHPAEPPVADGGEARWSMQREAGEYIIRDMTRSIRGRYRDPMVMGSHLVGALQERDKLQADLAALQQLLEETQEYARMRNRAMSLVEQNTELKG